MWKQAMKLAQLENIAKTYYLHTATSKYKENEHLTLLAYEFKIIKHIFTSRWQPYNHGKQKTCQQNSNTMW